MTWTRMSISLTGAAAVVSTLLATSTIWLLLTNPVTLASAIDQGTITPVVRQLADVLIDALYGLLTYL